MCPDMTVYGPAFDVVKDVLDTSIPAATSSSVLEQGAQLHPSPVLGFSVPFWHDETNKKLSYRRETARQLRMST